MLNTYTPFPPPEPDDWTKVPPGFMTHQPYPHRLIVVTQHQIITRATHLMFKGEREKALDLVHAMARALSYPRSVPRESIKLELIPLEGKGEA